MAWLIISACLIFSLFYTPTPAHFLHFTLRGQKFIVMCHVEYILVKVTINSGEPVCDQPGVRYVQEYSLSPRYSVSHWPVWDYSGSMSNSWTVPPDPFSVPWPWSDVCTAPCSHGLHPPKGWSTPLLLGESLGPLPGGVVISRPASWHRRPWAD